MCCVVDVDVDDVLCENVFSIVLFIDFVIECCCVYFLSGDFKCVI